MVLLIHCLVVFVTVLGSGFSLAFPYRPDVDPGIGYGSKNLEHCVPSDERLCEKRFSKHGYESAKRVTWYVPTQLEDGQKLPVVIYLHGYFSLVPEVYQSHINHLTRQGYIVIFPQFQGGLWKLITEAGIFEEVVQQDWLNNAVNAVDYVFAELGDLVDRDRVYGYGHSMGGAMLLGWEASGGASLRGMVLANAQTNPADGMPKFVRRLVQVRPLSWSQQARVINGNVMVLTGADDFLAMPHTARQIARSLVFASHVSVYELQTDRHGSEPLVADHMAAATNGSVPKIFSGLAKKIGGRIELNPYDHRFYYAALDAMIRDELDPDFDVGSWSDGKPVKKVKIVEFD